MKILKEVKKPTNNWSKKVKCGPLENAPPVDGCGSEVEITMKDVFHREIRTPQMIGRSFHWRCPVCFTTNFVPFTEIPSHDVPSAQSYLEQLRKDTMIEIARLHPTYERPSVIMNLGDDLLLDDDLVSSVLSMKELLQ